MRSIGIREDFYNTEKSRFKEFGGATNGAMSRILDRKITNNETYQIITGPLDDLVVVLEKFLQKKEQSKKAYISFENRKTAAINKVAKLEELFNIFGISVWN